MTAPPADAGDAYALGRSAGETRRLILQHQLYAAITRQFLVAAGVTAGMRAPDLPGTKIGRPGGPARREPAGWLALGVRTPSRRRR